MKLKSLLMQVLVVLLIAPAVAAAQAPRERPIVSVVQFDTDRTGWVPPPHFGETIADLLADRLVRSGQFRVVDREVLASAGEDRRPSLPRLRESAQQAGVDYLVIGSLTRFTTESRGHNVGGIIFPVIGGVGKNKTESIIGLTLRLIDVKSGEIATTATTLGDSSRDKLTIGGGGVLHGLPFAGGMTTSSSGAREVMVDDALTRAIAEAGQALAEVAAKLGASPSGPSR